MKIPFFAVLYALLWHGGGHLLAARALKISMPRLTRTSTGFRLLAARAFPGYRSEALCALGGPLGNLFGAALLSLSVRIGGEGAPAPLIREAVGLSCFWGCLNLLPLPGFDGWRVVRAELYLRAVRPERATVLLEWFGRAVLALLWLMAIYMLLRRGSALSLLFFCHRLFTSSCRNEKRIG